MFLKISNWNPGVGVLSMAMWFPLMVVIYLQYHLDARSVKCVSRLSKTPSSYSPLVLSFSWRQRPWNGRSFVAGLAIRSVYFGQANREYCASAATASATSHHDEEGVRTLDLAMRQALWAIHHLDSLTIRIPQVAAHPIHPLLLTSLPLLIVTSGARDSCLLAVFLLQTNPQHRFIFEEDFSIPIEDLFVWQITRQSFKNTNILIW